MKYLLLVMVLGLTACGPSQAQRQAGADAVAGAGALALLAGESSTSAAILGGVVRCVEVTAGCPAEEFPAPRTASGAIAASPHAWIGTLPPKPAPAPSFPSWLWEAAGWAGTVLLAGGSVAAVGAKIISRFLPGPWGIAANLLWSALAPALDKRLDVIKVDAMAHAVSHLPILLRVLDSLETGSEGHKALSDLISMVQDHAEQA